METNVIAIPKELMSEYVGQLMDDLKYVMQSAGADGVRAEYTDLGGMVVYMAKDGDSASFRVAP